MDDNQQLSLKKWLNKPVFRKNSRKNPNPM
jgi:hypothetical protein